MNRAYWDGLAEKFESTVFDIAANEVGGNLYRKIKGLGKQYRSAGDFGCGTGATTALLAKHFNSVVAVDFAKKLLAQAKERISSDNVRFIEADLSSKRSHLPSKVEVSFCLNALIHPDWQKRRGIAESVYRNTKKGGTVLVVVPSLESYLRTYQTLLDCRVSQGYSRRATVQSLSKSADRMIGSLIEGICDAGGAETKHFMEDEIAHLLEDVGFSIASVERVEFPWVEEIDDAPEWLGEPFPWDWLVTAGC